MRALILFVLFSVLAGTARAQPPLILGEGEPAPPLHVSAWVRGDAVNRIERGGVYVVEFWASWCAASKRAIPRLSALQHAHPDALTVLAISSRDMQGESLERVTALVSEQGGAMDYRVAFDDRRRTAREWLDTFEVRSVPTAFVVNREGVIAWIGNPLWPPGELEEAVDRVIAGRFSAADREELHRRHLERRERIAQAEREFEETDQIAQPARALRILETLLELNPDGAAAYALRKFDLLISNPRSLDDAYRFGREIADGALKDDADKLKTMAWTILDDSGLVRRDVDLAFKAALRAAELTQHRNADVLDTLALAHFRRGEVAKAIETEKHALELTPEEYLRSDYEERLKEYERAARGDR